MAVASIAVPPAPARGARAAQLVLTAPWPRVTLTRQQGAFPAGTVFDRVPSSKPDVRYVANGVCCTCPDAQQNGAICKHIRGVILWEQRQAQGSELRQAFADWSAGRAYVDDRGTYHVKAPGRSSGPVAPWNKVAKRAFPDVGAFHRAAMPPPRAALDRLNELYPPCAGGCGDLVERQGERCYRCLSDEVYRQDRERRSH